MKIGVVVHGPYIVDSGYALKIIKFLENYGEVKVRLGGTMGRTAVHDAHLEHLIDITSKRLPSASLDKFHQEGYHPIFLINYGKSNITGHGFGYKVFKRSQTKPAVIQIERPGEDDGSIIPWRKSLRPLAHELAQKMGLSVVLPAQIIKEIFREGTDCGHQHGHKTYRKLVGVTPDENIFLNGIVVGKSTSHEVIMVTEDGILTQMIGGKIKEHGLEKLGYIDLNKAVIKTGLLRRFNIAPRVIKSENNNNKIKVSFLNHAAEDIYRLKNADYVVTIGDDTTLVAADILYRFNVPIIGITDGDLDQVVENGFKSSGSMIIELEEGWDDIIGDIIFLEVFQEQETIEIDDIENFKKEILQIINNTAAKYYIKDTEFVEV